MRGHSGRRRLDYQGPDQGEDLGLAVLSWRQERQGDGLVGPRRDVEEEASSSSRMVLTVLLVSPTLYLAPCRYRRSKRNSAQVEEGSRPRLWAWFVHLLCRHRLDPLSEAVSSAAQAVEASRLHRRICVECHLWSRLRSLARLPPRTSPSLWPADHHYLQVPAIARESLHYAVPDARPRGCCRRWSLV